MAENFDVYMHREVFHVFQDPVYLSIV